MIKPAFKKIPITLKKLNQWVVWKKQARKGEKYQKIPYNMNNQKMAKVNDPKTWGSFEEAKKAFGNGGYDGIGIVVTKNDNIIGIDIDDCISNGELLSEYAELVNLLNTYTEISPSGDGIRCFLRGKANFSGFRNGNYEIYKCDRYLTVTGNWYKSTKRLIRFRKDELKFALKQYFNYPKENSFDPHKDVVEINLNPDDIIQLSEKIFFNDKMKLQKLERLFTEGDYKKCGYKSPSEGVLGLCHLLAIIFNGNFKKIEDAFFLSKLMNEKWKRNEIRHQTINKAILFYNNLNKPNTISNNNWDNINTKKYFNSGSMTVNEIIGSEIKPRQFIMKPWLKKPSISYIFGGQEVGKTVFALSLLRHITCGLSFGPWELVEPVKSFYYDVEMTKEDLKLYVSAMSHWGDEIKELKIFSSSFAQEQNLYINQNIFDQNWQNSIEHYLISNNIKLWVIDNVFMGADNSDLNNSMTWAGFNQWLKKLRTFEISTILIDHSSKTNKSIYGSTRKMVPADVIMKLENNYKDRKTNAKQIKVSFEKSRTNLDEKHKLNLKCSYFVENEKGRWDFVDQTENLKTNKIPEILKLISQGVVSQVEIAGRLDCTQPNISKYFKKIKEEKLIEGNGKKLKLTSQGEKYLSSH